MATAKANRNERTDEVTRRNVEQMRELVEQKHQQQEERAEAAQDNVLTGSDPEPDLENVIPDRRATRQPSGAPTASATRVAARPTRPTSTDGLGRPALLPGAGRAGRRRRGARPIGRAPHASWFVAPRSALAQPQ